MNDIIPQNPARIGMITLSAIALILTACSGSSQPATPIGTHTRVMALASDNAGNLYAATTGNGSRIPMGSVYLSKNGSGAWSAFAGVVPDNSKVISITADENNNVYAGTNGLGSRAGSVYVASQAKPSWNVVGGSAIPDGGVVIAVAASGGNVYAGSTGPGRSANGGVYYSAAGTAPWALVGGGKIPGYATRVHALAVSTTGAVYAADNSIARGASTGGSVYMAITPTSSWKLVGAGAMPNSKLVTALTVGTDGNVYAATNSRHKAGGIVYVSAGGGATAWQAIAPAIPDGGSINKLLVTKDKAIYVASGGGHVYQLLNAKWVAVGGSTVDDGIPVYALNVNTTGEVYAGTKSGKVFLAKAGDNSWHRAEGGEIPLNPGDSTPASPQAKTF